MKYKKILFALIFAINVSSNDIPYYSAKYKFESDEIKIVGVREFKKNQDEIKISQRVSKVIARAGICSRREAEKYILEGRVTVDGQILSSPATLVNKQNLILVDGEKLPKPEKLKLWRYHKPPGLVSTHYDPQGRPK